MTDVISWPIGKTLVGVERREYSWFFTFSGGGSLVTESVWRFITKEGIRVTSEDHGQQFGLESPVDAIARLLTAIREKKIMESQVVDGTSDLILKFEDESRLEFLNLSCGYESWRATFGADDVICLGGGTLWKNEKKG
jgi:hypothetical protein